MATKPMLRNFEYSYDVAENSVDINALLISQLHFTTIVTEVARVMNPDIEIKIRVVAPKEGSFEFHQFIEALIASNLLTKDNLDYLGSVFTVVGGLFSLKVWLKGKKAEKAVHNEDGVLVTFEGETRNVSVNIYNIYTKDKVVNSAIKKAFEAIETHEIIDGLDIKEDKKPITSISRAEFTPLIANNEYLDGETQEEIKHSVKLLVKNPDLIPKNKIVKWDFLWEGVTKIKATITDKNFLQSISTTAIRLGAYDALIVDLKVISKFDESINIYLPDSYEVVKVNRVDYRQTVIQKKIDDQN